MSRPECGYTGMISPGSVAADGSFVKPIGTGPFQWNEWKKGEYIRLAKFADYVSPVNDGKPDGMVGSSGRWPTASSSWLFRTPRP